ncbi:hypothetical protein [Spongorhabdus nitratireducens]
MKLPRQSIAFKLAKFSGRLLKRLLQAFCVVLVIGSISLAFILIERGEPPFRGKPILSKQASSKEVQQIIKRLKVLTHQEHSWLQLSRRDIRIMLHHGLARVQQLPLPVEINGSTDFRDESAEIAASISLNKWSGWFTRLGIEFGHRDDKPVINWLQLGRVTLSGEYAATAWRYLVYPWLPEQHQQSWNDAIASVEHVDINESAILVGIRLQEDFRERLKTTSLNDLVAPGTVEDRQLYQQVLEAAISTSKGENVSLTPVLRVLAGLAHTRTKAGNSAIAENRLLIHTLAKAVAPPEVSPMLGRGSAVKGASRLSIHNRHDLAQHLLISAALALQLGDDTALQIGFNKEMEDARPGGSGFNFTDLAADVAGIAFARIAVTPESAEHFQQFMMKHRQEDDFLPIPSGLPQSMSLTQFRDLYEGPGDPDYEEKFELIETTIGNAPLYLSVN